MHTNFKLTGLTCQACKKVSEKRLATIEGVTDVNVDLEQKTVDIESNLEVTLVEVNQALQGTPYEAKA